MAIKLSTKIPKNHNDSTEMLFISAIVVFVSLSVYKPNIFHMKVYFLNNNKLFSKAGSDVF